MLFLEIVINFVNLINMELVGGVYQHKKVWFNKNDAKIVWVGVV